MTSIGPQTVLVYGATGITGALAARRLAARGVPLIIAGRNESRLGALRDELAKGGAPVEVRVAAMTDRQALDRAFRGARVVVSAAGPFSESGTNVLGAAIDAGAHYLDTTGEQAFVRAAYDEYDERARARGVAAVPGFAFEIALGDFAATMAAERLSELRDRGDRKIDEIAVAYCVHRFGTSPGTRLSALEQLGRDGYLWQDGRVLAHPAEEKRTFPFPPPFGERATLSFPSSECLAVPRHVAVHRVQTFLAVSKANAAALHAGRRFMGPLLRSPIRRMAQRFAGNRGPTTTERAANRFCVLAEARRGSDVARVSIAGRDIYGFTATILADGVEQMLGPEFASRGTLSPAQAFSPRETLDRLRGEAGLEIVWLAS